MCDPRHPGPCPSSAAAPLQTRKSPSVTLDVHWRPVYFLRRATRRSRTPGDGDLPVMHVDANGFRGREVDKHIAARVRAVRPGLTELVERIVIFWLSSCPRSAAPASSVPAVRGRHRCRPTVCRPDPPGAPVPGAPGPLSEVMWPKKSETVTQRLDDEHYPLLHRPCCPRDGATPAYLRSLDEAKLLDPQHSGGGHHRLLRHELPAGRPGSGSSSTTAPPSRPRAASWSSRTSSTRRRRPSPTSATGEHPRSPGRAP